MGKPEFKSPRHRSALTTVGSRLTARPRVGTAGRSNSANVKVVIRVRPPNDREMDDNCKNVVQVVDEQLMVFDPKANSQPFFYHGVEQRGRDLLRKANKDLQFQFDRVFDHESTNQELFEHTTRDLIQNLMDGFNCSVFAYGATGAGKTHTMLGRPDNPGITYLTMAELFKSTEELRDERKFDLGIGYLEVYNELVQDLLNPGKPLQLRDDGKYGVMVAGIKIHKIQRPEELFTLLAKGNGNRTQHPTDANAESSRSHAVFQVFIQMEIKATREIRAAKLSMIDLAGSERGSATGFGGARFTEGANINRSLLALGNCINSLADGQKYVPYRDSKLTRLLKDSLGGNCQTVMIANVSPSSFSYEDTYNTLKYATRAKKIKADITRNVVNVELRSGEYVKIVEDLRKEVERLKAQMREKTVEKSKEVDPVLVAPLMKLIEQRRSLMERMYNLESSENVVIMRRHLKEETDSRLSQILYDTPEKLSAHQKIGDAVYRFQRREETLKTELTAMKLAQLDMEMKINELVKKHPELQAIAESENVKLSLAEAKYQGELTGRKYALLEEDHRFRGKTLEKTCRMLQSCYLQLKGHGFASNALSQEYEGLASEFQGRRNVTWGDDAIDSGLSSAASTSSMDAGTPNAAADQEDENPAAEAAFPLRRSPRTPQQSPLDHTFVLQPSVGSATSRPKAKVCAEELMAKVYKSPYRSPRVTKRAGLHNRDNGGVKENRRAALHAVTGTRALNSAGTRPVWGKADQISSGVLTGTRPVWGKAEPPKKKPFRT